MKGTASIELLGAHREVLPLLKEWFEAEWPSHYGTDGPGDAQRDLETFANHGSLPVGVVAFCGRDVCGVAALKAESITSHRHLSPWAAAGMVSPSERGQGIGTTAKCAGARGPGFGISPHLLRHKHRSIAVAALRVAAHREHHS